MRGRRGAWAERELSPHRRVDDGAAVHHLFETIILAILLVTAVIFVTTLDHPGSSDTDRTWRILRQANEDALGRWGESPPWDGTRRNPDTELGANLLDRLVRERFTDPDSGRAGWETVRELGFPDPGLRAQLEYQIMNRWSTLYGEEHGAPLGENVGVSRYVTPAWNAFYTHAKTEPLDGAAPGNFEALIVNKSRIAGQLGEAVLLTARFGSLTSNTNAPSGTEARVFGLAAQVGKTGVPTVDLSWDSLADTNVSGSEEASVTVQLARAGDARDFAVRVAPDSASLPVGAKLTFQIEPGFVDVTPVEEGGWSRDSQTNFTDGRVELVMRTTQDTTPGQSRYAKFTAVPLPRIDPSTGLATTDPPEFAFARIHAALGNGSLSRTTAIVRFGYVDADASSPRQLFPTLPYALEPGATARVGAVFQNGGEATTIEEFVIEVPGDYDFGRTHRGRMAADFFDTSVALTPLNPAPDAVGAASCELATRDENYFAVDSPTTIRWCGRRSVGAYESTTFLAEVTIQEVRTSVHNRTHSLSVGTSFDPLQREYWGSRIEFEKNGYVAWPVDGPGAWRDAPGIARFRVPPASAGDESDDGYPHAAGGDGRLGSGNYFTAEMVWQKKAFEGPSGRGASYRTADSVPLLNSIEGAVTNSSLSVEKRRVLPRDTIAVSVDFESVMRTLDGVAANLVDLRHTLELYVPASLPGKPFISFEEDLDNALDAPVLRLAGADVVAATPDGEIIMVSGDGSAYAVSAATGTITPPMAPHWNEEISSGSHVDVVAMLAGDVDPTVSAPDVLTLAADGRVTLIGGALGESEWTWDEFEEGLAVAFDAAVDDDAMVPGADGRVYALGTTELDTNLVFLMPDGSEVTTVTVSSQQEESGALATFQRTGSASDLGVVVPLRGGVVRAYGPNGGVMWNASVPFAGLVKAAAATNFANYSGGGGDELIIVYQDGVAALDGATGALIASYEPDGVTIDLVSVDADVTGSTALDVGVSDSDGAVRLLDLDLSPLPTGEEAERWGRRFEVNTLGYMHPFGPEELGDSLSEPDCAHAEIEDDQGNPIEVPGEAESLYHDVCNFNVAETYREANSEEITPTAIRLMSDEWGGGGDPMILLGGTAAVRGYVFSLSPTDGTPTRWRSQYIDDSTRYTPTAFAPVPRALGLAPYVAAGDDAGRLYLLEWDDGSSVWDHEVRPGGNAGEFTYYVTVPASALPGSYVLIATLEWDQALATGTLVPQSARVMNWFEVMYEDDVPLEGDFVLPVTLRTWRGEWDVCAPNAERLRGGDDDCDPETDA